MPQITRTLLSAGLLSALLWPCAQADDSYNRINLSAEVSREVPFDLMQVSLYSEAQQQDPAALSSQITTALNQALKIAKGEPKVQVSLGSRSSYPIYDKDGKQIIGWRERGELRLESADFATLSKLTGSLLSNLKMASMNFALADSTRKASEDELLNQAVQAFKARAALATQALGGTGYKVVNLNLSSGYNPPMPRMNMKALAMSADAAGAPVIEAGNAKVSINAEGSIEVQNVP